MYFYVIVLILEKIFLEGIKTNTFDSWVLQFDFSSPPRHVRWHKGTIFTWPAQCSSPLRSGKSCFNHVQSKNFYAKNCCKHLRCRDVSRSFVGTIYKYRAISCDSNVSTAPVTQGNAMKPCIGLPASFRSLSSLTWRKQVILMHWDPSIKLSSSKLQISDVLSTYLSPLHNC